MRRTSALMESGLGKTVHQGDKVAYQRRPRVLSMNFAMQLKDKTF